MPTLREALQHIVDRHAALRTVFPEQNGAAVALCRDRVELELPLIELGRAEATDTDTELAERLQQEALRPFDLSQELLLRASLFRLREHEHALLLVIHHIVADGWSLTVLCRELQALYDGRLKGESAEPAPLPIQY
uniref:condensation domain-containing protein n=1 Tax=Methylogaea oryzae TaxID=1295382 RepID=UPI0020D10586